MRNCINLELVGQAGQNPREVAIKSGKDCAAFSLACNIGPKENVRTHWYNIMVIGTSAKFVLDRVKKGDQVMIKDGIPVANTYVREGEVEGSVTVFANRVELIRSKN